MSACVTELVAEVSVSTGAEWEVSARAVMVGHLSPLGRTLVENAGVSGRKTNRAMAWQRIGAESWDSLMVSLTLVVILGTVELRVGPWLQQLSDGKTLVQERLADRNGHALV